MTLLTFNSGSVFFPELVGTALLVLMGCGVVAGVLLAHSKAQNAGWVVITFGWGLAVMIGAGSVADYGGASLNPAVTLGIWARAVTAGCNCCGSDCTVISSTVNAFSSRKHPIAVRSRADITAPVPSISPRSRPSART